MVVRQESSSQADRVLCAVDTAAASDTTTPRNTPTFHPHPGEIQDHLTVVVSRVAEKEEETVKEEEEEECVVPMVALECEVSLSGRLSPLAETPMSLPLLPAAAASPPGSDPREAPPSSCLPSSTSSLLPSFSSPSRPGCKRKLPHRDYDEEEDPYGEERCSLSETHGAGIACERCGEPCVEERRHKRRRLSHECSENGSYSFAGVGGGVGEGEEDVMDTTFQKTEKLAGGGEGEEGAEEAETHMDFSVEQTLDVITTTTTTTTSSLSSSSSAAAAASVEDVVVEQQSVDVVSTSVLTSPDIPPLDITLEPPLTPFVEEEEEEVQNQASQHGLDSAAERAIHVEVVEINHLDHPLPSDSSSHTSPSSHPQQPADSCDNLSSEEGDDDAFLGEVYPSPLPRAQRISPFLNTPKQRKEERRKILKLSIQKMRAVEDPELFLRRSVLINNTMKRLQKELREEKLRNSPRRGCYGLYRRPSPFHYDALNPGNATSYLLSDESFALNDNDRITDDMTDALVTRLEATSSQLVVPTPSPSPCPLDEPLGEEEEPCLAGFPPVSSSSDEVTTSSSTTLTPTPILTPSLTCLSDVVTSSVTADSMSVMNAEISSSPSFFGGEGGGGEDPCCSSLSEDLVGVPLPESSSSSSSPSVVEAVSMTSSLTDLTSSVDAMTSFVPDLTSPSSTNCVTSSTYNSPPSSPMSVPCNGGGTYDNFSSMVRESHSPSSSSSCSTESQREKQLYTDIDVVFNNLIHALGDS